MERNAETFERIFLKYINHTNVHKILNLYTDGWPAQANLVEALNAIYGSRITHYVNIHRRHEFVNHIDTAVE